MTICLNSLSNVTFFLNKIRIQLPLHPILESMYISGCGSQMKVLNSSPIIKKISVKSYTVMQCSVAVGRRFTLGSLVLTARRNSFPENYFTDST